MDPTDKYFCVKLFRDSCVRGNKGLFVKDLRIFSKIFDSENIFLVDNIVAAFSNQISNGIPIIPYNSENRKDRELMYLLRYLRMASRSKNTKKFNQNYFNLEFFGGRSDFSEALACYK